MEQKNIEPHKVTKPIQLLAAWLVGLVLVNGSFLGAAVSFDANSIERTFLTFASIFNVPLFLGAIFLLQTKFRPELQEDAYYSSYLDKKTQTVLEIKPIDDIRNSVNLLKHEFSLLTEKACSNNDEELYCTNISVSLSNKLSNKKEIYVDLIKYNIDDIIMFDPESKGNKPERKHMSMNPDIPFDHKIELLNICSKYNLDSYSYDSPNSINPEDAIIGGYGYSNTTYTINSELAKLLGNNPLQQDLMLFELEHEFS